MWTEQLEYTVRKGIHTFTFQPKCEKVGYEQQITQEVK